MFANGIALMKAPFYSHWGHVIGISGTSVNYYFKNISTHCLTLCRHFTAAAVRFLSALVNPFELNF